MSHFANLSAAEQVDNHRRLLSLATFLLSLIYGLQTVSYLVGQNAVLYVGMIAKGLAGLVLIVFFAMVYWRIRFIPKNLRSFLASVDSYVTHALYQAFLISWASTFVLLSLSMVTTRHDTSAFPAEFYLSLTLFCMLAVFSLSFFILMRGYGDEELDSEERE